VKGWHNKETAYAHIRRAHERFFLYGQRVEELRIQLEEERTEKEAL
jgi:hypothetical protein